MNKSNNIMPYLRLLQDNRGAMAALRCLLKPEQCFRGWQHVAAIDGIGDVAIETVAGLYALHPHEKTDEEYNFGDACRRLAVNRKTMEISEESPFDRRFRRLLSCDTRSELRLHLADIVRGMKASEVPVNYESLYRDIKYWGSRVRERWAIHYWSNRTGKEVENVSD
ncbi:MAG: type I-E CRISPR-associated protein Cse2/CasB [Akkermansia sp.]|nr:type I-E CRISPR-associated protein Cse2/CasB [Akkermansia sp.]